jgi:hypothetical protein
MKTLIVHHFTISFLVGVGLTFGLAKLAFGSTGTDVVTAVFGVCGLVYFVYSMETMAADLRNDRFTGRKRHE